MSKTTVNWQIDSYECQVSILKIIERELRRMERERFGIIDECKEELSEHILNSIKDTIDEMMETRDY